MVTSDTSAFSARAHSASFAKSATHRARIGMHAQEHSNFREGLVTGLIGAIVVMAWHLIMDTAAGQPFRTPNVLGKVFVGGNLSPARQIVPAAVLGYSVLHLIPFALMGMGLTFLVHL